LCFCRQPGAPSPPHRAWGEGGRAELRKRPAEREKLAAAPAGKKLTKESCGGPTLRPTRGKPSNQRSVREYADWKLGFQS
jgi:hypothetical protein